MLLSDAAAELPVNAAFETGGEYAETRKRLCGLLFLTLGDSVA
jgi:hypothetical protein